ncbi:FAR1-related sequence 5-like protein [Tanacetum coccineum]
MERRIMEEVTECMRTPRPTLYEQTDTPGGSIYWEPHVDGIPIPVEGNSYGSIDEAFHMYVKYAEIAGFEEAKRKQNQKQKRNTTTHATGCKAHIRLVLNIVSGRYKLETFNPKHNHMLIPKEYRHFTKKQRKMNQSEKMFVVKAAANKIGATKAHHLYCNIKGGYEYVHGTTDDFKNHQRDVNHFIEPTMIVTDQDGAMKRAIEAVFKKAKHRLCMWHIMQKIPTKICKEIYDQTDFKERFDKIVWNMSIEPVTFEEKWAQLIEAFDLKNHKWLTKMFDLREIWIPAYFIDSPLFGLMRTTSRSESENSFFKSFTSPGATLVSFMMSYESAMERQRYRQEKLDFNTIDAAPKFITQLDIESHASKVYTRTMFLIVQTEINEGCWNCTVQGLNRDEGCENFVIRDNKPNENKSLFHKKKQQKGKEKEKETQTVGQTARDYKIQNEIQNEVESHEIQLESSLLRFKCL